MKNPWLAALLNAIPGLGYLYLNTRRVLGWMLLGASVAFVISLFDPSASTSAGSGPYGIWNLWYALFFLLPYAGFIIDAYTEGLKINNANAPTTGNKKTKGRPAAGSVSPGLFVVLSFVTFGIYQIYWSWGLWETVRRSKGETYSFNSSLRGFFNGLSNFWLFPQLRDLAADKGYKPGVDVELLAAAYFILAFIARSRITPLTTIPFLALGYSVVLLPIVSMQNHYADATGGKFAPIKTNWWLIAAAVLLFVLSAAAFGLTTN